MPRGRGAQQTKEPPPPGAHARDEAGDQRDKAAGQRDQVAEQRDDAGDQRDEAGDSRDDAGDQRDHAAEQRDQAAEARDDIAEKSEAAIRARIMEVFDRSALARREAASDRNRSSQDRKAGASGRTDAELDRSTALADRGAGASERTEAELDRTTALADRGASAGDRADASIDDLTGVYLRGAGSVELERDIARARRDQLPLVLAFVDVDGLKATNDSHGHAAGDRLLLEVAKTLRATLRPYDLIIRYGGDEFLCAIPTIDLTEATIRLGLVNAALAAAPEHGSVSIGLAQLRPDESTEALIARADVALYADRGRKRAPASS